MNDQLTEKSKLFWEELCGSNAFLSLGLTEFNKESIQKFDKWYMHVYPYLYKYLNLKNLHRKKVLEIGLGLGTVGQQLFLSAKNYTGLDYSKNPVKILNKRIEWESSENKAIAIQGNAKELPFENETFDFIVSIGCLHHTGDIKKSIEEIYRVLKKGGETLVMLYSKESISYKLIYPIKYIYFTKIKKKKFDNFEHFVRYSCDFNSTGEAAPITEFSTRKDIKKLFLNFDKVSINTENFNSFTIPKINITVKREYLLNNVAKIFGLDFYIVAVK